MNWINLIITSLITGGGILAATYEVYAKRNGWPVGLYFTSQGLMTIVGGFVTLAAVVLSAFINPWWSIFIVFLIGWLICQITVSLFRKLSPIMSPFLMVIGIILLIILR